MGTEQEKGKLFINEMVMNEYTVREILLGIWTHKTSRNKLPVVIYLIAAVSPMIYAFVTGKNEYMLLAGIIILGGLLCLFVYLGVIAFIGSKKREKTVHQMIEKYGDQASLTIRIGKTICYSFNHNIEKTILYRDIEKITELDMYLILRLKNGGILPIWKAGFTEGKWEDFIPYFKQKMNNLRGV